MSTLAPSQPEVQAVHKPATKPRQSTGTHLAILLFFWLAIFVTSLATPPLLDDADATHAQAAQAMLRTGDYVTLHVDGVRYLEKAPLPYWMAALSLRLFGENAFAIHLPLALAVLGLSLLGYRWALRSFDRQTNSQTAFYTALFVLTSTGVFLFTRIFIPDALLSLLLAAALYALHLTLEPPQHLDSAIRETHPPHCHPERSEEPALSLSKGPALYLKRAVAVRTTALPGAPFTAESHPDVSGFAKMPARTALLFWLCMALAVLTKGLIAIVFLLGTAALYLTLIRSWHRWRSLRPGLGSLLFFAVAAPWHILAGVRNTGGANGHGFFWFYFVNEHVLRFLGRRIPRDYNKLPALLYWLLHLVWLFPWSFFAPVAAMLLWRKRRRLLAAETSAQRTFVLLSCFSALVLVFFSLSTNQEYYTFPVYLPLLMLLAAAVSRAHRASTQRTGVILSGAKDPRIPSASPRQPQAIPHRPSDQPLTRALRLGYTALAVTGTLLAAALAFCLWQAHSLPFAPDIGTALGHRNVGGYTLSMSHFFDLTGASFAALRLPAALALAALCIGPGVAWMLQHRRRQEGAVLVIAATSALFLIAAHIAFCRFAPVLSSSSFATTILQLEHDHYIPPGTPVAIFGDQSFGSSLPFYLHQPVQLVDGRSSSMLFGSTFPDAPPVFISPSDFVAMWGHGSRKLLFMPAEQRDAVSRLLGSAPQIVLLQSSGKELLTDRPLDSRADPAR